MITAHGSLEERTCCLLPSMEETAGGVWRRGVAASACFLPWTRGLGPGEGELGEGGRWRGARATSGAVAAVVVGARSGLRGGGARSLLWLAWWLEP
jgi:hypothetical protein